MTIREAATRPGVSTAKRVLFILIILFLGIGIAGCFPVPKAEFEIIE